MKKMFVQNHNAIGGAGMWIYRGYENAWKNLGYEIQYFDVDSKEIYSMLNLLAEEKKYDIMITDYVYKMWREMSHQNNFGTEIELAFAGAKRIYMFCQPESFPHPWGMHNNYVTFCNKNDIKLINSKDNIIKWAWLDIDLVKDKFYPTWEKIRQVPLAFDNFSYEYLEDEKYNFDVCFVGGRADNGFDEKYKIMMSHFREFKNSGLKCGIFVNKNLTHEQENKILYNSKVALNIHDAYQRELGLDTNERTFKALGLTGVLVSDEVDQLKNFFPEVKTTNDPKQMVKFVKEYVNMDESELNSIKEKNRKMILENHTYTHRALKLLEK